LIKKNLPEGVVCINPAKTSAEVLPNYLLHHPEVEQLLAQKGEVNFNVTKELASFHKVGSMIW